MRLLLRRVGGIAVPVLSALAWSGSPAGASLSLVVPNNAAAGYYTSGLAPSSASTAFVLPAFTCTGVEEDLILVEVNWSTTGNGHGADEVLINCSKSGAVPRFSTMVIAGGTDLPGPTVASGNVLAVSISGSSTQSSAKLVDVTTRKEVTSNGGPQTNAGVNAVFEIERLDVATPTFTTLGFKSLTVDGALLTTATSSSQDMATASSVVQAHANPITAGKGVISFRHS